MIADTIVGFHEVFYTSNEQLMTLRSKIYTNDLGLAFDDYFLKGHLDLLIGGYKKYFIPVLPREIYSTSTFTNTKLPNSDKKVMVEAITFTDYSSFLQYEYYKSLQLGHTVRICKNCKRAFLQTTKAHTIYCDRLYKDTNKTCRQYGLTRFHKEKVEDSPIHILYDRCKNKIDMRLYRLEKKYENDNKIIP